MKSCYSILECYNLFSGVKLSIRSFCFIVVITIVEVCSFHLNKHTITKIPRVVFTKIPLKIESYKSNELI